MEDIIKKLIDEYSELWEKKIVKKNKLFHTCGGLSNKNYYIESGIIKASVYNEEEQKEAIVGFFSGGECMLPYRNMPIQKQYNLTAVTEIIIYSISASNWDSIAKEKPTLIRNILDKDMLKIMGKLNAKSLIKVCPDIASKYKKALEIYPFLDKIKDEDVASFIGCGLRRIQEIRNW